MFFLKQKPKTKEPLTIFLDVDGVLNKESDWKTPFTLNESCISVFNSLWKELSKYYIPRLVLISTWRSGKNKDNECNTDSYNYLESTLKGIGVKISGSTPLSNKGRQNEVEYYIRRNDVGKYIVIDDDEKLYKRPDDINWYQPDFRTGLTNTDVKRIVAKINKVK